jgi:hypothetical protein
MSDAWKYRAIREIKERERREMELIESRKDIKVSKTKADGKHFYINIHGFKDEKDWNSLFKNIQVLVLNWQGNL